MAEHEMYDYLTTKTPGYSGTLAVSPQRTLVEKADKNQTVHEYDSSGVDVITLSADMIYEVSLQWSSLSESDSGTIFDFYNDPAKANGRENTFYWTHVDGHTYVARFMGPMSREYTAGLFAGRRTAIDQLTLRIEGRKAD